MAEFIYTMTKARKAVGEKLILDDVSMSFFPGAKIGVDRELDISRGFTVTESGLTILSKGQVVEG